MRPTSLSSKDHVPSKAWSNQAVELMGKKLALFPRSSPLALAIAMKIAELGPLVQKVECLRVSEDTRDVYEEVLALVEGPQTPSMGQSACSHVVIMCHPKAWGDRFVRGLDYVGWGQYLSELAEVANACGQAIYEAHAVQGRGNG